MAEARAHDLLRLVPDKSAESRAAVAVACQKMRHPKLAVKDSQTILVNSSKVVKGDWQQWGGRKEVTKLAWNEDGSAELYARRRALTKHLGATTTSEHRNYCGTTNRGAHYAGVHQ